MPLLSFPLNIHQPFSRTCFDAQIPPEDKQKTAMKVIVAGESEKVVGIHIIGMGADEMMQGFGVAMKVQYASVFFFLTSLTFFRCSRHRSKCVLVACSVAYPGQ